MEVITYLYTDDETGTNNQRGQLLTKFYEDAAQNNVRRFFEQENWQAVFSPQVLTPHLMGQIANTNYATLINPCDSNILFVHDISLGNTEQNVFFMFQREDLIGRRCD
jgi:hypothetical protein